MVRRVKSYGIIALGSVIYALAFDWFVAPNQIAMGGCHGSRPDRQRPACRSCRWA